jgi:hypothetical protein
LLSFAVAAPSYAYRTAGKTTGTEIALIWIGPALWDLTIETDGNADAGGALGFSGANGFMPNTARCDPLGNTLICSPVNGDDVGEPSTAGNFYVLLSVNASGSLNTGVNNPYTLGRLQGIDVDHTLEGIGILTGGSDETGLPAPVAFYRLVPEPSSLGLAVVGVLLCGIARRRRSIGQRGSMGVSGPS